MRNAMRSDAKRYDTNTTRGSRQHLVHRDDAMTARDMQVRQDGLVLHSLGYSPGSLRRSASSHCFSRRRFIELFGRLELTIATVFCILY
jgi:hypothetical protein